MSFTVDSRDLAFKHPFTALVSGPTGCGKTVLVSEILKSHEKLLADIVPNGKLRVLWAYGVWQDRYKRPIENTHTQYIDGLPNQADFNQFKPHVVVLDDLMTELGGNKSLSNLFTKGSHHQKISVIFIVQNMFHKAPEMRTISLNSHYMIILKNPRDKSQIMALARQLLPKKSLFLTEVYEDAVKEKYGYLVIDLKPDTPENLRYRSRILPSEAPDSIKGTVAPVIYLKK